jgi:hypothetical protein
MATPLGGVAATDFFTALHRAGKATLVFVRVPPCPAWFALRKNLEAPAFLLV